MKVNTEAENTVVVKMAEKALAIDDNIWRDYWMGGVKTENGTWMWQSGDPMDFTNWCEHCPEEDFFAFSQLGRNDYAGNFDTYYWARSGGYNVDNGVICEINADK